VRRNNEGKRRAFFNGSVRRKFSFTYAGRIEEKGFGGRDSIHAESPENENNIDRVRGEEKRHRITHYCLL